MLFGAHKNDVEDRNMQVTVAYNTFGPGLIQRLPRWVLNFFIQTHYVDIDHADIKRDFITCSLCTKSLKVITSVQYHDQVMHMIVLG